MKKEVDQVEFKGTRLYLVNNLSFSFYIQTGDLTCDQYVSLPLSATVAHLHTLDQKINISATSPRGATRTTRASRSPRPPRDM